MFVCNLIPSVSASLLFITNNSSGCNSVTEIDDKCNGIYPVTSGLLDQCMTISTVDISAASGNNNAFVNILDPSGQIVCSINANGNDLGSTTVDVYVSSTARTSGNGIPYMNRNITITPTTQPSTPVTVKTYYTAAEYNALLAADASITDYSDIDISKTSTTCTATYSGVETFIPQNSSGNYGSTGNIFIESDYSSFSTIFANGQNLALPLIWSTPLRVTSKSEISKLSFGVTAQINNQLFEIEHSSNGTRFQYIGEIVGEMSLRPEQDYHYIHTQPTQGTNYYRIKQIDIDGRYTYSNVAVTTKRSSQLKLSPNPCRSYINIEGVTKENIPYEIINTNGILVLEGIIDDNNRIDVAHMDSGLYIISVEELHYRFYKNK